MDKLADFGIIPITCSVLESVFDNYSSPQNKIAELEKKGELIRLKRGMYVISNTVSHQLLSLELIANHIYGPSYVSMQSALRYYGLIPENVYTVKSMTTKRSREFNNKIAKFSYISCDKDYYPLGINLVSKESYSFLIASPEKALCDLIAHTPNLNLRFIKSLKIYLEDDLRFDMSFLKDMNLDILKECALHSKKKNDVNNIIKLIQNEYI